MNIISQVSGLDNTVPVPETLREEDKQKFKIFFYSVIAENLMETNRTFRDIIDRRRTCPDIESYKPPKRNPRKPTRKGNTNPVCANAMNST